MGCMQTRVVLYTVLTVLDAGGLHDSCEAPGLKPTGHSTPEGTECSCKARLWLVSSVLSAVINTVAAFVQSCSSSSWVLTRSTGPAHKMRRIFGTSKPQAPAPTLDEATDKLGTRGDRLDDNIKKLDTQLAQFKEQIKKTRPGPAQEAIKRRAMQVLKQKKLYEGQRDQLYQQQFNVEQTKFTVDSIQDTVHTVQALSAASKQMKTAFKKHKELDIGYIDNMQDDMWDMMDMSREINDALGQSYDVPDGLDETDLMAELDALEEDMTLEDGHKDSVPSYLQEPDLADLPAAPNQPAATAEPQPLRN